MTAVKICLFYVFQKSLIIHISESVMSKNIKGYTVMELVVVMFALSVITAAIAPFIRLNVESYIQLGEGKAMVQTARISFAKMLNELRYLNDLDVMNSDHIRFDAYVDSTQKNNIHYRYGTDSEGNKGIARAENVVLAFEEDYDPLIGGVESFSFSYLDNIGGAAGSTSDVHRIKITMVIRHEGKRMSLIGQVCVNTI